MSDTPNLANSIWPNGIKVDSDGYAVFYPLGTNKVNVPTSSSQWPKGDKFVSYFVYQNDKLVGFIDTKALTTDSQTLIYLPYTHIEADFSAINKGQLQIHAPNAITKKASWKDSGVEDIPEVQFKYKGCKTVGDVKSVDYNFNTTDIVDGVWSELLLDLEEGGSDYQPDGMFYYCSDITSFSSNLPNLTNGHCMFSNCTNLISFNSDLPSLTDGASMFEKTKLASWNIDLPSLTNGINMFYANNLSSWNIDLPSLTESRYMFRDCTNLISFNGDLSSLTDGHGMFYWCTNLTSFSSKLSSLTNGASMFEKTKLASWNIDLPSLTIGNSMFYGCTNLTSFSSNLSSLTSGNAMFNGCKFTSFNVDLSSLTDGNRMFYGCYKLTSFSSDLSSLTDGKNMFYNCKLDTHSVQNIADTINSYAGTIHISIGNSTPNTQEITAFDKIASKGWTVYVNTKLYTPSVPAAIVTLDENGEEISTPIPYYAKPVQSDEEHARYVDPEGNFFDIIGAQFIYGDDLSTYGMFTCEEDAAANMRLTPYIKPIERN